jgi:hypothetical protein
LPFTATALKSSIEVYWLKSCMHFSYPCLLSSPDVISLTIVMGGVQTTHYFNFFVSLLFPRGYVQILFSKILNLRPFSWSKKSFSPPIGVLFPLGEETTFHAHMKLVSP